MKNGKYIVSTALIAFVLAPSVAFASWWNPLSWSWTSFLSGKSPAVQQVPPPSQTPPTSTNLNTPSAGVVAPTATPISVKNTTEKLAPLSNAKIIAKVKPAIVYIDVEDGDASGMILQSAATYSYILTNAHVVVGVSSATITLQSGKSISATVVGRDENTDLAILKISAGNLPTVVLGNSDTLAQGDKVFALGYPFGIGGDAVFTDGIVSKTKASTSAGQTYIQNTAEIHPGNSGGALIDQYGQVVGVTSASYSDQKVQGVTLGETIKLAIPINTAKALIPQLESGLSVVVPVATPAPTQAAAPSTPAPTEAQCQQAGQDAYDQHMASVVGISTDDPTVQSLLADIQSNEDRIKSQHDSSVAQIHASNDPLIAAAKDSDAKLQASFQTSAALSGRPASAVQQVPPSPVIAQIQAQEQTLIAQADANYRSAYSQWEAQKQKVLTDVENKKTAAESAANAAKKGAYAGCMAQ